MPKKIESDDTIGIQNPVFAILDAESKSKFYENQWTAKKKAAANLIKNILYEKYGSRPRVFLNFRERFIAIKVAQPKPSEKKNPELRTYEKELANFGITRHEKSGNIIYHMT